MRKGYEILYRHGLTRSKAYGMAYWPVVHKSPNPSGSTAKETAKLLLLQISQ